jgi:glucose-6-phosphate 1-dehydrogenase
VETFTSITLKSKDPAWRGVPVTLRTGKAIDKKTTEITIYYRKHDCFESNTLTLRIQPDEGAEISIWAKRPGYERVVEAHTIDFSYGEHYDSLPDAYERVLVDAIRGDHSYFVLGDEVLASWKVLEPLRRAWEMTDRDLLLYKKKLPLMISGDRIS